MSEEVIVTGARGESIIVEIVGEPDAERVMKRHQHVFNFAAKTETVDHTHEVMANRDHVHRLSKTTSWSRFYKDESDE